MSLRKRFFRSRFFTAVNRDSFYIVLFLCLVLLAATAVWVTRDNIRYFSQNQLPIEENRIQEEYPPEETEPLENSPAVSIEDGQEWQDAETEQPQSEVAAVQQPEKETAEAPKQAAAAVSSQAQSSGTAAERMRAPLLGKIIMDYGKDNLVYSKTLEQWTTHHGIDISASIGTPVKAVMSGTVTEVTNHPTLGIMITIDHGNGLVTRYANLQNGNMVKEGQKVEQGKVISGVGNTAEFEIGDVPHLHFEVLKNGEHQDPKLYLPNM
ncbi:MAG TPA: M23 family metallopeptidase [Clostridia bacterium]|jgi:murein DD-endopeptidase MepM/ murein hydrolase activator NlpD|nr:M23 family metallopeptidase [Clostridia bacterium]